MTRAAYDVVVVGAGFAGLTAGVRAAELGLSVAVLEKGATADYLCNSRISGGVFHVAQEDVTKPADVIRAAIQKMTYGYADARLADALAAAVGPAMTWLGEQGATFIRSGAVAGNTLMLAPPRPLGAPLAWMETWNGMGPDKALRLLARRLAALSGALLLGVEAQSLVMEDGACVGVQASSAGVPTQISARAVVLADGGFQANMDMVARHISARPGSIRARHAGTASGDGIRMAQAIGAALTPLNGFYGHLLSRDAITDERFWPYPLLDGVAVAGIVVDQTGERFCDEGNGGVAIANAVAGLPDPLASIVIFDEAIWNSSGRKAHVSSPNPTLYDMGGTIHVANTIEDLAALAGVPLASLKAAIEAHNEACRSGNFAALTPARTSGRYAPMPIESAPFYAIPACAGMTYTMGGLKIDASARVVGANDLPIEGLYAAGSITGGLEGGPRLAYVSGLSKAVTFGKIAAEAIAARQGKARVKNIAPSPSTQRSYPALRFLLRYGDQLAAIAGVALFIAAGAAGVMSGSVWIAIAALCGGACVGGFAVLILRSYVELIRIMTDTLLPNG